MILKILLPTFRIIYSYIHFEILFRNTFSIRTSIILYNFQKLLVAHGAGGVPTFTESVRLQYTCYIT